MSLNKLVLCIVYIDVKLFYMEAKNKTMEFSNILITRLS